MNFWGCSPYVIRGLTREFVEKSSKDRFMVHMNTVHHKWFCKLIINSCLFFFRKIYYDLNKDNILTMVRPFDKLMVLSKVEAQAQGGKSSTLSSDRRAKPNHRTA